MITKKTAYQYLGDKLILWINPQTIDYQVDTKWPITQSVQKKVDWLLKPLPSIKTKAISFLRRRESFVIPDSYYQIPKPIKSNQMYNSILDLIHKRENYKNSNWYQEMLVHLSRNGEVMHKKILIKCESELDHFFENYVLDLINSMESDGYRLDKGAEVGSAMVGTDGELHKSGSGGHRFYSAKILGVKPFPIRIVGVHRCWFRTLNIPNRSSGLAKLYDALLEVGEKHQ